MTRKRWKLIALWTAAVALAIVAAGAVVYQAARSAVETDVQEVCNKSPEAGFEPDIGFRRLRLVRESWLIFEFDIDLHSEVNDSHLNDMIWEWGLRERAVTFRGRRERGMTYRIDPPLKTVRSWGK